MHTGNNPKAKRDILLRGIKDRSNEHNAAAATLASQGLNAQEPLAYSTVLQQDQRVTGASLK